MRKTSDFIAWIFLASVVAIALSLNVFGSSVTSSVSSGGGTWGSITGTLSSQTDLNTALNGKASTANVNYALATAALNR